MAAVKLAIDMPIIVHLIPAVVGLYILTPVTPTDRAVKFLNVLAINYPRAIAKTTGSPGAVVIVEESENTIVVTLSDPFTAVLPVTERKDKFDPISNDAPPLVENNLPSTRFIASSPLSIKAVLLEFVVLGVRPVIAVRLI